MKFKKGKFRIDLNKENVWFVADEHYGHTSILKHCDRPYLTIEQMDMSLIQNHNYVVKNDDIVFHLGDFTLLNNYEKVNEKYISKLNGKHIFLKGSHDYWLKDKNALALIEVMVNNTHLTLCHYCLRTWPRSHYNSYHLFGHSHGKLPSIGKSHDVGVDNNEYFPLSFYDICDIMKNKEDNVNLIRK